MSSSSKYEIKPTQSVELLKELHILTRDGKLNQDSRRKLKQVYHLVQFIEPLIKDVLESQSELTLVDHGAGKSYLGFILYDLFFRQHAVNSRIYSIETRAELVERAREVAFELVDADPELSQSPVLLGEVRLLFSDSDEEFLFKN